MAQPVKTGIAIYEEEFRNNTLKTLMTLALEDDPMEVPDEDVHKLMAKYAMRANTNEVQNHAIELVNGFKSDWGTGVSTRVMVYNALGVPLKYRSGSDDSGYWSTHTMPDRLEVGEWACGFHHKSSGAAKGSCAVVGFDVLGYGNDDVLMVGFNTPWSGSNTALCKVLTTKTWSPTSWDDIHGWVNNSGRSGSEKFGRALVKYSTDDSSSPTLRVIVTRSDIGQ